MSWKKFSNDEPRGIDRILICDENVIIGGGSRKGDGLSMIASEYPSWCIPITDGMRWIKIQDLASIDKILWRKFSPDSVPNSKRQIVLFYQKEKNFVTDASFKDGMLRNYHYHNFIITDDVLWTYQDEIPKPND